MSGKNSLENVHQFIHWDWGQNYPFNGCMSFLLECLGENQEFYDYWFFSGVSGDIFTMCYGNNNCFNDCVSVCSNGPELIKWVFDKIGYDFEYVTRQEINANKEKYLQKVMEYIDKGVPVLERGAPENSNYDVIYEYSDNGRTLLYMVGDEQYKGEIDAAKEIDRDWIFIGEKKQSHAIAGIYREIVFQIPCWLTMPKTERGVSFGPAAFNDWADDIENGRYAPENIKVSPEEYDTWKEYTIYVCNLSTNGGGAKEFLDRAYRYNPDLTFIPEIVEQYLATKKLWNELEEIGGGFNIRPDILKDAEKRSVIVSKIREFSKCMENVIAIVKRNQK